MKQFTIDDIGPDSSDEDIKWFFEVMKARADSMTPEQRASSQMWIDLVSQGPAEPVEPIKPEEFKRVVKLWHKRMLERDADS